MPRDACANAVGCGFTELTFWQYLAACVVVDENGCYRLNTLDADGTCSSYTPAIKCGMDNSNPMATLKNIFALDSCGNMAVKLVNVTEVIT